MIDPDGRHYDQLGRQVPHRLNALTFARGIPGFTAQLRVHAGASAAGEGHLTVQCPCGESQALEHLTINACGCGRHFINGGGRQALVAHPGALAPNNSSEMPDA